MKKIMVLLLSALLSVSFAQTAVKRDKKFAQLAAQGNLVEIKLVRLVMLNSATPEVIKAGTNAAMDHVKAKDELDSMAKAKNIVLPIFLSEEHQERFNRMEALRGIEFDHFCIAYMLDLHKQSLKLFKRAARRSKDEELKTWALAKVSILENHLKDWSEAYKAIKIALKSKAGTELRN